MGLWGTVELSETDAKERFRRCCPDFRADAEKCLDGLFYCIGLDKDTKREEIIYDSPMVSICIFGKIHLRRGVAVGTSSPVMLQENRYAKYLADLYESSGIQALLGLTGDFILLVGDRMTNISYVIRDRLGGRKLFYTVTDRGLTFSDRISSLLRLPGVSREINRYGLESFLKYGYIIAPNTIYRDIKEIEPGQLIEINKPKYDIRRYWSIEAPEPIHDNKPAIMKRLREEITESVARRIREGERIGVYLSGGIDSNTILSTILRLMPGCPVTTISAGYKTEYVDYNELPLAKTSAQYFGTRHHELTLGPEDIEKHLARMVWTFEQPYGNPALVSWLVLGDYAREFSDVVFVGAGPDEVLGGYRRYNGLNLLKYYYSMPRIPVEKYLAGLLGRFAGSANHYSLLNRAIKFFEGLNPNLLRTNDYWLCGDYSKMRVNLLNRIFIDNASGDEPSLSTLYQISPGSDPLMKVFLADCYSNLISEQLARALIPLERYGVDYRAPFCDPDFIKTSLSIPNKYKMGIFSTKIIYREAVKGFLPPEIVRQKKRGMSIPMNAWLRGPLYESLKAVISPDNEALREYFNIPFLKEAAEAHYAKRKNMGEILWKIIVFSMWYKLFILDSGTILPDIKIKDIV